MVGWSGRRKALLILAFIAPTLIGILILNIYPILFNVFISFTNRNQYHPNPDCSAAITSILEPTCWPMFKDKAPKGIAQPYRIQSPAYQNYYDLFVKNFNRDALLGLVRMAAVFVPLVVAYYVNKNFDKRLERPISSTLLWIITILVIIVLAWLVDFVGAYNAVTNVSDFFLVVMRSILFVAIRVPLTFVYGLILALILNSNYIRGRTFFRVVLFIPWAASSMGILIALVWQFFFRDQGTINALLSLIGVQGTAWLNNPTTAFGAIILTDIWLSYPFFMIAILGALTSIGPEQYEAAEMDGANWWQELTHITLPLIRPAVLPAAVLTSITAFQMFGTAYAMTGGGPSQGAAKPGSTEVVMVYIYKQAFQTQAYGKVGAFAVIIFVFLFLVTFYSLRITRITKGAFE